MKLSTLVSSVVALAIHLGALFGSAGTVRWPQAWIFLLIMLLLSGALRVQLARINPDLLRERQRSPFQADQATWDKVFQMVFLPCYAAWLILMGLDAVRFTWSHVPIWLEIIGGLALCASFPLLSWIFRENAYAAPVVKLQEERGQHVITTGPYAIVRHPMYVCMIVLFPAVALLLGSWFGLLGAGLLGLLVIVRTALEDRLLRRQLDGYADYAHNVKSRLFPGLW